MQSGSYDVLLANQSGTILPPVPTLTPRQPTSYPVAMNGADDFLTAQHLRKHFDGITAVDDVSFSI